MSAPQLAPIGVRAECTRAIGSCRHISYPSAFPTPCGAPSMARGQYSPNRRARKRQTPHGAAILQNLRATGATTPANQPCATPPPSRRRRRAASSAIARRIVPVRVPVRPARRPVAVRAIASAGAWCATPPCSRWPGSGLVVRPAGTRLTRSLTGTRRLRRLANAGSGWTDAIRSIPVRRR